MRGGGGGWGHFSIPSEQSFLHINKSMTYHSDTNYEPAISNLVDGFIAL